MAAALAAIGVIALFILADQYQWARNILGGMILVAFLLFLLFVH